MKFEKIKHCLSSEINSDLKKKCQVDIDTFRNSIPNDYKLKVELNEALVSTQNRIEYELKIQKSLKARKFKSIEEADNAFAKSKHTINVVKMTEDGYWDDYFNLKDGKKSDFSFDFSILIVTCFVFLIFVLIYSFVKSNTNNIMKAITYLKHFKMYEYVSVLERKLLQEKNEFRNEYSNEKTAINYVSRFKLLTLSMRDAKVYEKIELTPQEEALIIEINNNLELLEDLYHKDISLKSKRATNQFLTKVNKDVEEIDFSTDEKFIESNIKEIKAKLKKSIYDKSED